MNLLKNDLKKILLFLILPLAYSAEKANASAAPLKPCDILLKKVQSSEIWSKDSALKVGRDLRNNGSTTLELGLRVDRTDLVQIFNSHPIFELPTGQFKSREIQYWKEAGWQPDNEAQEDLMKISTGFPEEYRTLGRFIGNQIENLLNQALPEENLELVSFTLRWNNPKIAVRRGDGDFDEYFIHQDFANVHLRSTLALYGDGTLSWGPILEPGTTPIQVPTGDIFLFSGFGRERFFNERIKATYHSSPHSNKETERILFLFSFKPKSPIGKTP